MGKIRYQILLSVVCGVLNACASGVVTGNEEEPFSKEATKNQANEVFQELTARETAENTIPDKAKKPDNGQNPESTIPITEDKESPDVKTLRIDKDGCTWVESQASISFGENDTKHQAKAQAVSEARAKAMNHILGVNLRHQFMDFQQESLKGEISLTESLLRVTQLGRVLKEKILLAKPEDVGTCPACRFRVIIQTCIVPQQEKLDKGFRVNLSLNRTRLRNGEEGIIKATSTRDAYLYIYNVDMDWKATLIFPNAYFKNNLLKAGEVFTFPNETARKKGIRIVAKLPEKRDISAEMIRIIASKIPLPQSLTVPAKEEAPSENLHNTTELHGEGSFLNLMRRLNATTIDWVDDAQAFTIEK